MPALETVVSDQRLDGLAREAQVIRVRDYIAQYRAKLEAGCAGSKTVRPEAERALIEAQLTTWEVELQEALHPGKAPTAEPPGAMNALVTMVQQLTNELAELKAKFLPAKEPHGRSVAEPQTPAHPQA